MERAAAIASGLDGERDSVALERALELPGDELVRDVDELTCGAGTRELLHRDRAWFSRAVAPLPKPVKKGRDDVHHRRAGLGRDAEADAHARLARTHGHALRELLHLALGGVY